MLDSGTNNNNNNKVFLFEKWPLNMSFVKNVKLVNIQCIEL